MKRLFCFWLFLPLISFAESNPPRQMADSLWQVWQDGTQSDSMRLKALDAFIWRKHLFTQPDSAFYYAQLEFEYASSRGLQMHMADALNTQGISFAIRSNYIKAIDYFVNSLKIKEEIGDQAGVANLLNNIGIIYENQGDYQRAIDNYMQSLEIQEELGNMKGMANALNNIGNSFYNQNDFIKAIDYHTRSLNLKEQIGDKKGISESLNNLGLVYQKQGDLSKALDAFTQSLKIKEEFENKQSIANSLNNIGFLYLQQGNYNSALLFSRRALNMAKEVGAVSQTRDAARSLWEIHKNSGNYKQGLDMHELYVMMRDSIVSEENVKEVIRQEYQYAYEKQALADSLANARAAELKNAQIAQQQAELKAKRNQQYGLFIGLALMVILAGNAYYRAQSKKKANEVLQKTLADLKATQAQLIQQEKLASLGQLTAGIAHEIKNPLNFVNNFSEVSIEMIDEIREEIAVVKTQYIASPPGDSKNIQSITDILNDIEANLRKIHEHGSRANGIVSSMLQHSRGGSGKKESTDLNALIKEYVNLSFHGMRAGKNPINVDIQLDLDDSIGKIALIEEDFSRVLLNLCNNAFDAMREKTKTDPGYKPLLSISTKQKENAVEIVIADNGPGIPDEIKDKIMQPFFTTKKGTEGTGLGLSITHDIVKAHGGEIKIKSYENEGTEFTIELPI